MRVVVFDLGDTLVEYEGMPLSWEAHYPGALLALAQVLGVSINDAEMEAACGVLRRYNTRIHGRLNEVSFGSILVSLAEVLGVRAVVGERDAARAFFAVFRQRLRCFPDSRAALSELRARGVRIGIFTDVPYGMPTELVLEDVEMAGLRGSFDVFLSSRDVGLRKPSPETLRHMATLLNCTASEMTCVGNERKDIDVANAFGCTSVLVDRAGKRPNWGQTRTVDSLRGI